MMKKKVWNRRAHLTEQDRVERSRFQITIAHPEVVSEGEWCGDLHMIA